MNGLINAEIRPQVQGYILTKNYHEGDVVQAGTLLFQIDPREFQAKLEQAQGDLARAQAAQGKTQLDVNRRSPGRARSARRSSTTPCSRIRPTWRRWLPPAPPSTRPS